MTRFKLTIEYDGGPYCGWQRQDNGLSVQQCIEEAVERFCQQKIIVHGAGRTDAGVHALGQVAHIDLAKDVDAETVRDALNFYLKPQPITVLAAAVVPAEFHARFSAIGRAYIYRIINRRAPLALDLGRAWHVLVPILDAEAMDAAAQRLLGHHDFSSFRSSECQADSAMKTLDAIAVKRQGDIISIAVHARSFLHRQVRIMTGTLKLVGEGKWTADDVSAALEAKERAKAGPTAPPDGLYLTRVEY